jgi:hypothetical protein
MTLPLVFIKSQKRVRTNDLDQEKTRPQVSSSKKGIGTEQLCSTQGNTVGGQEKERETEYAYGRLQVGKQKKGQKKER